MNSAIVIVVIAFYIILLGILTWSMKSIYCDTHKEKKEILDSDKEDEGGALS